ncbi:MAG: adenosylcobalamin-dependent ribonucleoside-diphosphate reductase [Chloroflexi bacterium]|nr:adenosylcobalamin-dependent ribonucleoside-diphosphate reductase [Chloroflexota bacterium]
MMATQKTALKGLLPTPPLPKGLPKVNLTENAFKVFMRRYVRKGPDGQPVETPEETFWRVAYHVAKAEGEFGATEKQVMDQAKTFYKLLVAKRYIPNSPTWTGAGTPLGQLAACFVLPISDDMGRRDSGIFTTLRNAALIQQTGGGNGFSFSRLRPKGTIVKSSAGQATGPVGFLRVYDKAFGEIAQGGSRRGANMAVLRVDHPDIEEFITCKTDENAITNFNISVGITDAFMRAVENDEEWELRFPDVLDPRYDDFDGTLEQAEDAGIPIRVYRKVRARELFDKIVRQAHHNGEPGLLFLDTANRSNPVPHLYPLEATNPCGEQWLGPYENCCLGSINLAQHATKDGKVDWKKLQETTELAVRFLDDVVQANAYVPSVPQLKEAAHRARRIGLGIMGLADLMYINGVRYGSPEAQEFAAQVMEFIRYHAMRTSIELAKERGPFPAIKGSVYDPDNLKWEPPKWPDWLGGKPQTDWGRPPLDWDAIVEGIRKHGIRNAAQTTIAPTGTVSTISGVEGYGCEPVFALAYIRHVDDNGKDLQLTYTSPLFMEALKKAGLDEETRNYIIEQVLEQGTCQHIPEVPEHIKHTFVVAHDITAEEHVYMQAALQVFVDNSISKTINFPSHATPDDVAKAYKLAWKLGIKGLTVYVTGSRDKVVLETKATAKAKGKDVALETPSVAAASSDGQPQQPRLWNEPKKPRPSVLHGWTYRIETPVGRTFVTINENGGNQPFEVFVNTSKAGSETAAISEAIGRLISYILRLTSTVEPRERLWEVWRQLNGIGGGRSAGFGPNRVRSLPDGIAQAIKRYLDKEPGVVDHDDEGEKHTFDLNLPSLLPTDGNGSHPQGEVEPLKVAAAQAQEGAAQAEEEKRLDINQVGDICPECGAAAVVYTEGCARCYACGYSECK